VLLDAVYEEGEPLSLELKMTSFRAYFLQHVNSALSAVGEVDSG
jgi:hypothetical protein